MFSEEPDWILAPDYQVDPAYNQGKKLGIIGVSTPPITAPSVVGISKHADLACSGLSLAGICAVLSWCHHPIAAHNPTLQSWRNKHPSPMKFPRLSSKTATKLGEDLSIS